MLPDNSWNICQSHISEATCYRTLNDIDPLNIVQQTATQFADKYKSMPILVNKSIANIGPVYHTSSISEIFRIIIELSLAMILHIAKDFFKN